MKPVLMFAAAALVVSPVAFACEDYDVSAMAKVPASIAPSQPVASKAPSNVTRKADTAPVKQAKAKAVAQQDKQPIVAELRKQ